MTIGKTEVNISREIYQWKQLACPGPDAVLLTVRCDIRYTPEELEIYRQIRDHWGDDSLHKHLVVLFTVGDCLDQSIEEEVVDTPDINNFKLSEEKKQEEMYSTMGRSVV
nr:hypothetical protein BaRGS_011038 [Batillaria attramentaria]